MEKANWSISTLMSIGIAVVLAEVVVFQVIMVVCHDTVSITTKIPSSEKRIGIQMG